MYGTAWAIADVGPLPPSERRPEWVLEDVEDGILSVEAAERDYGVVVRPGDRPWRFELDRDATDAQRNIYTRQHHVADRGGVDMPEVGGHLDLRNSVQIADATVYNQSRCVRRLGKIIKEVVTNNCSVDLLPKEVNHQHVPGLYHVDGSLICKARDAAPFGLSFRNVINVRAQRHELHGECASDQILASMNDFEFVHELIVEPFLIKPGPDFFR